MKVACHKVTVAAVTFLFAFCNSIQMSIAQEAAVAAETTAASAAPSVNLDLSSTAATVTFAPHAEAPINIQMAGAVQAVMPGQMVTPAMAAAAYQVMRGAEQTLILGANGAATGGSMNISPWLGQHLNSMTIPQGVSVINNFANNPALNLAGSLTNAGAFYAVSTNSAFSTASIAAANIVNQQSALLTSIMPAGGLPGITNAISNLSLSLSAINNIVNAGTISSAGALTMTAGGSITNAAAAAGLSAIMQAMSNVNLNAASIVNSGLISSLTGNINIASQLSGSATAQALQALNVHNVGGTMQALNGSINVGNILSSLSPVNTNINLYGGNWLSKALNVNAGQGSFIATVGQLTGDLSIQALAAHVYANTPTLNLGNTKIDGDPTFASTGDIRLVGSVTAAEALSLIAQGNIYIPNNATVSISTTGVNSDITLIAGATIACPGCPEGSPLPGASPITPLDTVTVTFTPGNGGYIDLASNNTLASNQAVIDASASNGNVTLAAYSNSANTGYVKLLKTDNSIITAGDGTGGQGNITVIVGGTQDPNNIGFSSSNLTTSNGGGISITTAQPIATSLEYAADGSHTGTLTADATIVANSTVTTGNLSASGGNGVFPGENGVDGGAISITAGGAVQTGNIVGNGGNGVAGADGAPDTVGGLGGAGGSGSTINITSMNSSIYLGTVTANAGLAGAGGRGGDTAGLGPGATGGLGGNGGNGGTLLLTSGTSVSLGNVVANAGAAGSGGNGGDGLSGGNGGKGGDGGIGGTVDFVAGTFITLFDDGPNGSITANGAIGGNGGDGGNGGSVGGTGGLGGLGGIGGCACLQAGNFINLGSVTVNGANGGNGGNSFGAGAPTFGAAAGDGGFGGSVTLEAVSTINSGVLTSIGGNGGVPGNGVSGGPGGANGGDGGPILIMSQGDIGMLSQRIGNIITIGGAGSIGNDGTAFNAGGAGGTGGLGGNVTLISNANIFANDITSTGGLGGNGGGSQTTGAGGDGGLGGGISVQADNNIVAGTLTSSGGVGGNAGDGLAGTTGGSGGNGNTVELTSVLSGNISAQGAYSFGGNAGNGGGGVGAAGTGGVGGNGDAVTLTAPGLVFDTSAGSVGGNGGLGGNATVIAGTGGGGGNPGAISISADLGIATTNILSVGGTAGNGGNATGTPGTGGKGGDAGAVSLTSTNGYIVDVVIDSLASDGGLGGNQFTPGTDGDGGAGGNGNNVTLTAGLFIDNVTSSVRAGVGGGSLGTIFNYGSDGAPANLTLIAGDSVTNALLNGMTGSSGGMGTNVSVSAGAEISTFDIYTFGGAAAGDVTLVAGTFIQDFTILASGLTGRNGSISADGYSGGFGGNVSLTAGLDIGAVGTFVINAVGAYGGTGGDGTFVGGFGDGGNGGAGGNGGTIVLNAGGSIGNSSVGSTTVSVEGGGGGTGGRGFSGGGNGSGGHGGNAGLIAFFSGGNVGPSVGFLSAAGGTGGTASPTPSFGTPAGNGGHGGTGGIITVNAAGDIGTSTLTFLTVSVNGGAGGPGGPANGAAPSGSGGNGNNAGSIQLISGGTIASSIGALTANGGNGGIGGTGTAGATGGTGGNAGNGGIINLFAAESIGTTAAPLTDADAIAGVAGEGGFDCCPPSTQQPSGAPGLDGIMSFASGSVDGINFGGATSLASLQAGSITFITEYNTANPTLTKVLPTFGAYYVGQFELLGTGISIVGSVAASRPLTVAQNTTGDLNVGDISGSSEAFAVFQSLISGQGTAILDPSVTNLTGPGAAPAGQDLLVLANANITENGAGIIDQSSGIDQIPGGQIVIVGGTQAFLSVGDYGTGTGVSPFVTIRESVDGGNVFAGNTYPTTNSNLVYVQAKAPATATPGQLMLAAITTSGTSAAAPSANGMPGGTVIVASGGPMQLGIISANGGNGSSGFSNDTFGGMGGMGGLVNVVGANAVVITQVTAYGGGGGGGVASLDLNHIVNGGAGGIGGFVYISNANGSLLPLGGVNVSGGGGGGGSAYSIPTPYGGKGGVGGAGGQIILDSKSIYTLSTNDVIIAASGGAGGNGGASGATGSGGGGGGGGAFGAGGLFGSGSEGSSTGGDGTDGLSDGTGGLGGLAGDPDSTSGLNGQDAGQGFAPGGQIVVKAQSITAFGSIASGPFTGNTFVAAGIGGTIDITTWAAVSTTEYSTDANYGPFANTTSVTINPGTLDTAGGLIAGIQPPSATSEPITINDVGFTSPQPGGVYAGPTTVNITESGNIFAVSDTDALTPAEIVALVQVSTSSTGEQPLVLTGTGLGRGFASGGSFEIGEGNVGVVPSFTDLVLPANVTLRLNIPTVSFLNPAEISGTFTATTDNPLVFFDTSLTLNGTLNFFTTNPGANLVVPTLNLGNGSMMTSNGSLQISATGSDIVINLLGGTSTIELSLATGTELAIYAGPLNNLTISSIGNSTLNLQTGSPVFPVVFSGSTLTIGQGVTLQGMELTSIGLQGARVDINGTVKAANGFSPFCCFVAIYPFADNDALVVTGNGLLEGQGVLFGFNFVPVPTIFAHSVGVTGNLLINGTLGIITNSSAGNAVFFTPGTFVTATNGIAIDTSQLTNSGTLTDTSDNGIILGDDFTGAGIIDQSTGVFNAVETIYDFINGPISFTGTPTYNGLLSIYDSGNFGVAIQPTAFITANGGNGNIAVVSDVGDPLNIFSDGGTFLANKIIFTADTGDLTFTGVGAGTVNLGGSTIMTAETGSVVSAGALFLHGNNTVRINSPDTGSPLIFDFVPPTNVIRSATGTAPDANNAAVLIVTDPLAISGTIVATAAPVPPTPLVYPTTTENNTNTFTLPNLGNNSQNTTVEAIGTRLPTDNTLVIPPGDTTQEVPGGPLNGQVSKYNDSAIEATIVNTSQFNPLVLNNLAANGLNSGPNSGNNFYNLDRGSGIFTPNDHAIVVRTHEGDVHIDKGSAVHVYETGADVCILNLDDQYKGAVKVVAGGKLITVQPGKALVLTRMMSADFDRVNPLPSIATRRTKEIPLSDNIKAFVSDFSILSAMMHITPLKQLVTSSKPQDKQLAHTLLKNALLITNFSAMTSGPYKSTP